MHIADFCPIRAGLEPLQQFAPSGGDYRLEEFPRERAFGSARVAIYWRIGLVSKYRRQANRGEHGKLELLTSRESLFHS